MNKTYLIAGALFFVIVGSALAWRISQPEAGQPLAETTAEIVPTLSDSISTSGATPSVAPTKSEGKSMKSKQYSAQPAMSIDTAKTYTATMGTDKGAIKLALFAKETPITVNNFVFLSREGFYDNVVFHRIIKGFMVQGGDPTGTGSGGPGYKFADERVTRDYTRGTIAMANAGPDTNGSQFFIMHADGPLPKNYVIFGVIEAGDAASFATLDAIANTPTMDNGSGEGSTPVTPPVIKSITIEER